MVLFLPKQRNMVVPADDDQIVPPLFEFLMGEYIAVGIEEGGYPAFLKKPFYGCRAARATTGMHQYFTFSTHAFTVST